MKRNLSNELVGASSHYKTLTAPENGPFKDIWHREGRSGVEKEFRPLIRTFHLDATLHILKIRSKLV